MRTTWDFPGGPKVKNPPTNAVDMGSIPGLGMNTPHASKQWSLCATTTEPVCLELMSCNKRSHLNQKPKHHTKALTQQDPMQPKIIFFKREQAGLSLK